MKAKTNTVLYNYLCLHDVRQGYLTVLTNIYTQYYTIDPPFNIIILIQKFPYEKYFKNQPKIKNIEFKVVNDINGKVKRGIFEQILVPYWALKMKVDAIYMPATFSLFFNVKPILLFFHVSISFTLPPKYLGRSRFQAFIHNFIIKKTSIKSELIHCTTHQTRSELLDYIDYNSEKVTVNHNGISCKILQEDLKEDINYRINEPFILSVSAFYRHKKQDSVISAFIHLKNNNANFKNLKLILVGAVHEKDYFNELIKLAGVFPNDIIFLHNITSDHLEYLYKNCSLYVFLSIFEGFGLTPFEALFHKKQVLISDIPTLKEIYGENANYVNAYDIVEISQNIKNLLLKTSVNINIESMYEKFSWLNFVMKLNKDLIKILNKK